MNKEFQLFYKGKNVFVTGHTGFKGSWLTYWLKLLGAEVLGYALPPDTSESLYNLMNGDSLCSSVLADIRDVPTLEKTISDFQPDIVFHLAAQPLVRLSYEMPDDTFETNVLGTGYLLSAVRKLVKPCSIVLITTDKVYENREWVYPYRENDRLGGLDPYSASKAAAEILIHSYTHSYFNTNNYGAHKKAISVARAGNVIGGGDWAKDRIIPDIVKSFINGQPVQVRNPNAVRPWQHVLEPLAGYLLLAKKITENPLEFCGAYNFGPHAEDTFSVRQVAERAIEVWGEGSFETPMLENQPHEAGLLKLDINKAQTLLGWHPKWNAATSIEKTIAWYKKIATGNVDVQGLLAGDIASYQSQVK
jgi:CDP-glucose 4,6-dehydratase